MASARAARDARIHTAVGARGVGTIALLAEGLLEHRRVRVPAVTDEARILAGTVAAAELVTIAVVADARLVARPEDAVGGGRAGAGAAPAAARQRAERATLRADRGAAEGHAAPHAGVRTRGAARLAQALAG